MDYKKSLEILIKILKEKNTLSAEEKEAIQTAIGVLDAAAIGKKMFESRLKAKKEKREKDTKWKR